MQEKRLLTKAREAKAKRINDENEKSLIVLLDIPHSIAI